MAVSGGHREGEVARGLDQRLRGFWSVALFSGVVNLLMLAGPLYMLQVYDRVLASRSVPTLVALSVALVGAFAIQGVLDIIRGRIVVRAAASLDEALGSLVHNAVVRLAVLARRPAEALQPLRDLDQIRSFLSGAGPIAIVDLPWMPVFLVLCFLIHPWLGALATASAVLLMVLAIETERASRPPMREFGEQSGRRSAILEADRRNGESVVAMGMVENAARRWAASNDRYVAASARSSDVINLYGSAIKILRLLMQSAMLGLGAYLVLQQELSPGAMIAAAIMMGRALAPIETAIANWRGFLGARDGHRRLSEVLRRLPAPTVATGLPAPCQNIEVRDLAVSVPGGASVVAGVAFRLEAGEALGVIGPSGSGKTSLVRALTGVWPAARGTIRLDGATLDQWSVEARGRFVGYLAQGVDLFDATIADNIARLDPEPDAARVIAAARAAGAHALVLRLPGGYDAPIGEGGAVLSAGQRQRIGLARALYGDPFLIVLDEPNANLDREGDEALQAAIAAAKARGAIVIMIAHRPSALTHCDKVLVLGNGVQQAFGPRDAVLRSAAAAPVQAPAAGVSLKLVSEGNGTGEP